MSIGSFVGSAVHALSGLASKAYSAIKPYAGAIVGGAVGGPAGAALGQQVFGPSNLPALPGGTRAITSAPGVGFTGRGLSMTPMTTQQLIMSGGYSRGRVASINRAAGTMCAKYPQWCMSIGGVGAVASAMASGQLPIPRRRRGRGISPRDLRSFRRVANLIKHYAAPVHRMRTHTRRK